MCTKPQEIEDKNFTKIKEKFLDNSNTVIDDKLQEFVKTKIKKGFFGKSSEIFQEDNKLILLELLVLMVVGKGEKLPSTTKLVFDFVSLVKNKKQFLEECFQSDDGVKDLISCILFLVQDLRIVNNDKDKAKDDDKECNCDNEKHQLLVEWVSSLFEVKEEPKYKDAFKSLAVEFLSVHKYNKNIVADCVQTSLEFRKDGRRNRSPILQSLTSFLPETKRFGTLSSWLSVAVVFTILKSLFYLSDFGSDVYLGLEYRPKYNITTCALNGTEACGGGLSLEYHQKHRESYLQYIGTQCTTI